MTRRLILPLLLVVAVAVATGGLLPRGGDAPVGRIDELLANGDYGQAESLARKAFATAPRFGARAGYRETAASRLVESLLLNGRGAEAATLSLAEQAVRLSERSPGGGDSGLATALLNLGRVLIEKPDVAGALVVIARAQSLQEQHRPPDPMAVAEGLDTLGYALVRAGRHDDAIEALERCLRVRDTTPDASGDIAHTLATLGHAFQRKAEYPRAGQLIRRAEAIAAERWNERPAHAEVLDLLGLQYWFEGNLVAARETAQRAVAIGERALRPDHPALARSLRYLAGAELDLGNVAMARTLLERATGIIERARGRDHPETTLYLNDLAGPTLSLGDYPAARQLYERALQTAETAHGPWHDTVATAAYNLAIVDKSLGDLEAARADLERARQVWERTFRPDHPFVALALTDLASVRREQGASGDAIALLQQALAIRENSLGRDHRDVAMTLADMAATRVAAGQFDDARPLVSRAVAIWERQQAPDAPDYAVVLALNARLETTLGDPQASRMYARRALQIRQRVFGSAHPMVAEARAILAEAEASLGNTDTAVELAASAESGGLDHLRLLLRSLPEREALNYASSRPKGLDAILSILRPGSASVPVAFDRVIRGRGVVLDEMAARRAVRASMSAEGSALRLTLDAARQRLANLVVRGPGQLSSEQHAALVADAREGAERAERSLAEHSAAFRSELHLAQIGLTEVQASLPSGGVLVSYVRYDHGSFGSEGSGRSRRPSYAAFIQRPLSPPIVVRLGEAAEIEPLVTAWRDAIARYPSTVNAPRDDRSRQSGRRLRAVVWDPLSTHLEGSSRVFVVPDGALGLVPIAALPAGESSFLLEVAPPIHYLTAERDLVSTPRRPGARGMLALGGATFDDGPAMVASRALAGSAGEGDTGVDRSAQPCGDLRTLRFQSLAGTLQEVEELSSLWRQAGAASSEAVRVIVGRDADETTFKRDAHRYRVLHLATHGFFLGERCSAGAMGTTRGVGGLSGTVPVENPLLISGLALAGANRRASAAPDEDDGILTAEEVASLDLSGVEWAVLSACDTGVGEIRAGEGVFGLRRAFQVAGARTVVMSLWSVDDQATRAWMRALYEGRFQRKLSTADAVHEASLSMLRDRRAKSLSTHPFYWAAFVAAGDWR